MKDADIRQCLVLGRGKIAPQDAWNQHVEARASDGTTVNCTNPRAVKFCALGAVRRAATEIKDRGPDCELLYKAATDALADQLATRVGYSDEDILRFNDKPGTRQADVLEIFDDAIEAIDKGQRYA